VASEASATTRREAVETVETVPETPARTAKSLAQRVKAKPAPVALAGIGMAVTSVGIGWMLAHARAHGNAREGGEGQLAERASGKMQRIVASVRHGAENVASGTAELARDARSRERRFQTAVSETFYMHTLAAAATVFAAGTAVGMALPSPLR
jgi:hypothetical protein